MQPPPPGFGPQKVRLGDLIHRVVDNSNEELTQLVRRRNPGNDAQRKENILAWARSARRRFLHLYVLQKWAASGLEVVAKCEKLEMFLNEQKIKLAECQDSFFFMIYGGGAPGMERRGLYACRERQWDIPTAIDVLANRQVCRLPRSIATAGAPPPPQAWDREYTIQRLEDAIRFRLLDTQAVRELLERYSRRVPSTEC